jgi:hypothetical protein
MQFEALCALTVVVHLVGAVSAFQSATSVGACAAGSLFKQDYLGLGCYPDDHREQYYAPVRELERERERSQTFMFGVVGAIVVLIVITFALLGTRDEPKKAVKSS